MLTFAARGYAPTTPLTKADCSMDFEGCQERTEQEDIQRRHALAPAHIYRLLHGNILPLWGRSHSVRSAGVHKLRSLAMQDCEASTRGAQGPTSGRRLPSRQNVTTAHLTREKGLLMNIPLLAFHLTVYKIHLAYSCQTKLSVLCHR